MVEMRANLQPRISTAQTPMPRPHPATPRVTHRPEACLARVTQPGPI